MHKKWVKRGGKEGLVVDGPPQCGALGVGRCGHGERDVPDDLMQSEQKGLRKKLKVVPHKKRINCGLLI